MPKHVPEPADHQVLRAEVRTLCEQFPLSYWQECDINRQYPERFVVEFMKSGLASAMIPKEFGGLGLSLDQAAVILEEIHRSGGNASACHAQMYTMGALVRHGSPEQKRHWLPRIASGELRLQAFSVTERESGSDTKAIRTTAIREGPAFVINGTKNWTSRIEQSDLALILARSGDDPVEDQVSGGMSLFIVDLEDARRQQALIVEPAPTWMNYATYQVTYRNLRVPDGNVIGAEGAGFRAILDGMNAERIQLAAEAIGDGYWFIEQAASRATARETFGRPIGANQGIQFPIARAYTEVFAADQVRKVAARLFDDGMNCGAEANMVKLLASEASWQAGNVCLDTFGGDGFLIGHHVERKLRETRLYQTAPVSNNLVLAYLGHRTLGLPKSY